MADSLKMIIIDSGKTANDTTGTAWRACQGDRRLPAEGAAAGERAGWVLRLSRPSPGAIPRSTVQAASDLAKRTWALGPRNQRAVQGRWQEAQERTKEWSAGQGTK